VLGEPRPQLCFGLVNAHKHSRWVVRVSERALVRDDKPKLSRRCDVLFAPGTGQSCDWIRSAIGQGHRTRLCIDIVGIRSVRKVSHDFSVPLFRR